MQIDYMKLSSPPNTRKCLNEDDWGDEATIGLHVKTKDPTSKAFKSQFGIYLGDGEIGLIDLKNKFVGKIKYLNLKVMKETWVLD